jgi:hypothetical protein
MAGGRPVKYEEEFHCQLAKFYSRWGHDDEYVAGRFGITMSTLYLWKKKYAKFSEAMSTSKDFWDSVVEDNLLSICKEREVTDTEVVVKPDKKGGNNSTTGGNIERIKRKTRKLSPEAQACLTWLRIRQPDKWRESKDTPEGVDMLVDMMIDHAAKLKQGIFVSPKPGVNPLNTGSGGVPLSGPNSPIDTAGSE